MSKILIVVSAAAVWERVDGATYPTGYWAEELAAPHKRFVEAGYTVDFASPGGGVLQPLDEHSASPEIAGVGCARYVVHAKKALREFGPLPKLDEVDIHDYVTVVPSGGYGPVVEGTSWLLSARLRGLGAVCSGGTAWQRFNVRHDNTGQNRAPIAPMAEDMIAALALRHGWYASVN
ncbi:type 1 glutamine amidotransferase domain-containing protein [Streptomyces sp. NPDC051976]|uniref:type 1 glutamine amidotransferase domain-containing protein n=1 Tax=Streptomyces sp. NPDC051976 TaxID=3154947 RepID=UPI003420F3F1